MSILSSVVERVLGDLNDLDIRFAIVGGLAVGARGRARQTVDADFAIGISEDRVARQFIDQLVVRGYGESNLYENEHTKQLCLAKLFAPHKYEPLIELDFLFNLCGIEAEVVATAEPLELWPGVIAPIASTASLLAMKARCQELPERIQDRADLLNQLLPYSSSEDIEEAKKLIKLIEDRGYNEGRDLTAGFGRLVQQANIV